MRLYINNILEKFLSQTVHNNNYDKHYNIMFKSHTILN